MSFNDMFKTEVSKLFGYKSHTRVRAHNTQHNRHTHTHCGVMVLVVGNGHGNTNSNPDEANCT